ncbi:MULTISPECIES: FadD3 family acyl-CoA ligase [unclassified Streptomyces]|uniref:FadD3 family acyl-CoA ligase n=1 Tax=unclassified Streptomyces TaxID=2593676 RepID=UPI002E8021CD|nr:FadD3 family acyl-CoA ligase [Streptomyces sp. NBC_00589]WTI35610.1 FadD3 family acyl-CoA ligase [Streptomyces sp. NBC_00775]WUB30717.1 FadD3 family acyl-CoA ligase [Streptomyces sp. NBC_00589]
MRYDDTFLSIPHAIRIASRSFGDDTALIDGSRRWSFRELERQMAEAVKATVALGVEPGDRVGLCAPNSAEWIFAALGIQGAGGVIVPLNTRFKAPEISYILRKSGAKALIASPFLGNDYIAELRKTDPGLPALRKTVSIPSWPEFLLRGRGVSTSLVHELIDQLTPDDVSDVMFTSGTTGHPKGVVLTHGQSLRAYGWMAEEYTFARSDSFLVIPPFFHCFGYKAGWLASLMHGVTVIPMPVFDAGRALDIIAREKVSILLGPPTIFQDLIRHPDRPSYDLSSLRVSMTGGTTIPESLIRAMKSELSFDIVMSAYGLTESTALVTTTRIGDSEETVARTTGRVIPDVEIRIADDESSGAGGKSAPPGQDGEVLVRGYNVTRGYWEDPEATAAAIDPEGWLRTGDIGRLDEDGNLSIVDRKKDMYIVGGFNAYPAEIEKSLLGHELIEQAAVIGVPDERLGEVGCAFVVVKPGHHVTEKDIVEWARENMANFKVPRHVRFSGQLPRNASQKVLKDELRARFVSGD